jgi:hypothetical protein
MKREVSTVARLDEPRLTQGVPKFRHRLRRITPEALNKQAGAARYILLAPAVGIGALRVAVRRQQAAGRKAAKRVECMSSGLLQMVHGAPWHRSEMYA